MGNTGGAPTLDNNLHILSLLAQKCHVDVPQNQTQVQPKEQKEEASVTERQTAQSSTVQHPLPSLWPWYTALNFRACR